MKFSECPVKFLGIFVGYDNEICEKLNWNNKINKMETTLRLWRKRNLTLFGKVTVVNILCFSKLIYNCILLHDPEAIILSIKKKTRPKGALVP